MIIMPAMPRLLRNLPRSWYLHTMRFCKYCQSTGKAHGKKAPESLMVLQDVASFTTSSQTACKASHALGHAQNSVNMHGTAVVVEVRSTPSV